MNKVFIFDYDGTIVDSTNLVKAAFNRIAEKYGLKKTISDREFGKLYEGNMYEELIKRGLDVARIKEFISDWIDPLLESYTSIKLFKGIKKVIAKLSINNKLYVITSNSSRVILSSIDHLGIKGVSEVLGGDKEKSKVVKIESVKKYYSNCKVYYIGDTSGDMIEAKKADAISIGVTWGLHSRKKLKDAGADYIVDKPEELLDVLVY
jgi:phosphoglycolate phosphatase